jgi:YidC/Oxa1 family membrane protein insertase
MRAKGKDPDEIAAKRRGAPKKRQQAADYDPTKVARQSTTRSTTAKSSTASGQPATSSADGTSTSSGQPGVERQVIQRQQPKKNSRAARKQ